MPWNSKKYNRINWKNRPSTATALGATNLNKMDVFLNDVDNYLITLDAGKLDVSTANGLLKTLEINVKTGKIKATELGGTKHEWDMNLEKIPISFSLHSDGVLVMTTDDGTEFEANIADAIRNYEFVDTNTIDFTKTYDEPGQEGNYNNKGTYTIKANIKPGSIKADLLDPDWRADVQQFKNDAESAAADSLQYSKDAKRYSEGDTSYPESETDNAKYYYEQAKKSQSAALTSEQNAAESADAAATSETNAANSESAAESSASAAYMSESNAEESKNSAAASAESANASASSATKSQTAAESSATAAERSATNAAESETEAENWKKLAESFAHGQTGGTREDEDSDNAKYYYEQAKRISQGLEGSLLPMGTIEFSELATSTKQAGYMYNISDAFTSTTEFKDGGGKYYGAGANVYWTADDAWDVLAPVMVSGVKGSSESMYHQGNVTLSAANVGAVPVTRKVNSKPLSADVTLAATDVGALAVDGKAVNAAKADSAAKLTTSHTIFGKTFDGTQNVVGQALVCGTYNATASNRYTNGALQIRENGQVGSAQTDLGYAPAIGFHWLGKTAGTVALGSDSIFHFLTQAWAKATIDANVNGNATSASTATELTTARALQVSLSGTSAPTFNGTADVKNIGVTGTLPVARGGTGVTALVGSTGLIHAMFDTSLTSAGFVPVFTDSWADGGYMSMANLKTALALNNVNNTADANKSVKSAGTLTTARALQVNLASTSAPTFNGSADVKGIGVTGILGVAHGGTGNATGYVQVGQKAGSAIGNNATAEGYNVTSSSNYCHAEGYDTVASGQACHAEGMQTTASGYESHAEGRTTTASGNYSHAEGENTVAKTDCTHAGGRGTIAAAVSQTAIGKYNVERTNQSDALFIIGNGTSSSRSNAFRVTSNGTTYAKAAYNSSGADYAEFFEWKDGNENGEDRRGYFVTLIGDKIRKATQEDSYILGIVSSNPSVIGNSPDEWHGRYKTNEWGEYVKENITIEEKVPRVEVYEKTETDEDGKEYIVQIPYTVEETVMTETDSYILNPEFRESEGQYVPRERRPEWAAVGMLGVLRVVDDGTCRVNGYCNVAPGGIATDALEGWRVISRVNDHIVKVVFGPQYYYKPRY